MNRKISIDIVKSALVRYPTLGDYYSINGEDVYTITAMPQDGMTLAIAVHELVEFMLCQRDGVREKSITDFDISFETGRCHGEPGDDPAAPYRKQHQAATSVERAVIAAFGLSWEDYEKECEKIFENEHRK